MIGNQRSTLVLHSSFSILRNRLPFSLSVWHARAWKLSVVMDPSVDVSQFSRHLNTLYKKWEEGDVFEETDSIVVLYSRILDDPDVFPNPNVRQFCGYVTCSSCFYT